MKTLFQTVGLLVLSLSLAACGGGGGAAAPADSPEVAVIEGMEDAWNAEDLDTVMSYYTDDAYSTNGLGKFTGKDAIRSIFSSVIGVFTQDCRNYTQNGNTLTYECFLQARDGSNTSLEFYETIIEDGKIKSEIMTGADRNP